MCKTTHQSVITQITPICVIIIFKETIQKEIKYFLQLISTHCPSYLNMWYTKRSHVDRFWRRPKRSFLPTYFASFQEECCHILHGLLVTFHRITGLHAWQMSSRYFSTPPLIYLAAKLWARRKNVYEKVKENGWELGGVICWNMNYKPELHHLDRENTHGSGEPGRRIRLARGSICTSWNQSHSLIWLGQPHRRKRKLLCSLIKLIFFCVPLHAPPPACCVYQWVWVVQVG